MPRIHFTGEPETDELIVAQALDRYSNMFPTQAHAAIADEWGEQMAVLFETAVFKIPCGDSDEMREFLEQERGDDSGTYILVPICTCEWDEWRR
jgi:hypothetical protein